MSEDAGFDGLREALAPRYLVERSLGEGGMAWVYLALEPKHNRRVAIKVLRSELAGPHGPDRFIREIALSAQLSHPNILPLLDSGEVSGLPFYVMPFVDGESLRERILREKQLPLDEALRIAMEVAEALQSAHRHGIVHRDIKPANILLEEGHAVIADFGIARAVELAGFSQLTTVGMVVGTPAYSSPEQASGSTDIDGRSDLYSLGCVLFEMLAGEPPFTGVSARAVTAKHLCLPIPRISVFRPTASERLDAVLAKALAKCPADRFQTAAEFHDALRAVTEELLVKNGRARPMRSGASTRARVRIAVAATIVAAAALMVASWHILRPPPRLDPNRIVVFPALPSGLTDRDQAALDVATTVGYALEGTEPLRWLDGSDQLSKEELRNPQRVSTARRRAIARNLGAGFFVDGSVVLGPDSMSVILRLHEAAGDSVVAQGGASAPLATAHAGSLALAAVRQLIPALVGTAPTGRLDILSARDPAAFANWLQGEHAYRQSRMRQALISFERALQQDSAMAPAALGASMAAAWEGRINEARDYIRIARKHEQLLTPLRAQFARAMEHYLDGRADSALVGVARVLATYPLSSDAWMLLGTTAYHLLPSPAVLGAVASRSMAAMIVSYPERAPPALQETEVAIRAGKAWTGTDVEKAAMETALALDSAFRPPMIQLAELALREGDVRRADILFRRWRAVDPDSNELKRAQLEVECVRDGAASVDWKRLSASSPGVVLDAGLILAQGMARPECAEPAFIGVLRSRAASVSQRWGALLGQQSLLFAQGRWLELSNLLDSPEAAGLGGPNLYLLDAAEGAPFAQKASSIASDGPPLTETPSARLWLRGVWASSQQDSGTLRQIAYILRARADSNGSRVDSLLADIMDARATLVDVGGPRAIEKLTRLSPNAPRDGLTWQPWESLAAERVLLARTLLAAGRARDAIAVASQVDNPEPIVHLVYLPSSLAVREKAARLMGDTVLAAHYLARLQALRPAVQNR